MPSSACEMDPGNLTALGVCYNDLTQSLDTAFLIYMGGLVYFMQTGFNCLEAGSVRVKNLKDILLKNFTDNLISAFFFWSFGYSWAFGSQSSPVIGSDYFFVGGKNAVGNKVDSLTGDSIPFWFFEWGFCCAATTIVKGALAERLTFPAYFTIVIALSGFIYPLVVHWSWCPGGLLTNYIGITRNNFSFLDFAGSTVVHIVGGSSALISTIIIGPRFGRFDDSGRSRPLLGYSSSLTTLGTFILFVGWFGFNPGSSLSLAGTLRYSAANAAATSLVAASTAGLVTFFFKFASTRSYNLEATCNALLTGLVAITGPSGYVSIWAAFIIGVVAAFVYMFAAWLIIKIRLDDVAEAIPVHFAGGIAGAIMTGLFADRTLVAYAKGVDENTVIDYGLFLGGGGRLLAVQLIGVFLVMTWVFVTLGSVVLTLKYFRVLRVSKDLEIAGIDSKGHGPCSWARVEMNDEGMNFSEYQFRVQ